MAILKPEGNILAAVSRSMREKLDLMLSAGDYDLQIDMSNVELMDSTGIGVLVAVHNRLAQKSGALKLINTPDKIRRMLQLMNLDRRFTII